jgi:hypothetical protein
MEFSYKITLQKGIKYFVIFAFPFLVDQFILTMPDIANLTIGACLLMLVNMLKVKYGLRFP